MTRVLFQMAYIDIKIVKLGQWESTYVLVIAKLQLPLVNFCYPDIDIYRSKQHPDHICMVLYVWVIQLLNWPIGIDMNFRLLLPLVDLSYPISMLGHIPCDGIF